MMQKNCPKFFNRMFFSLYFPPILLHSTLTKMGSLHPPIPRGEGREKKDGRAAEKFPKRCAGWL